ncbi:MAG: hypothetical protein ACOCQR_03700 [bacterium]
MIYLDLILEDFVKDGQVIDNDKIKFKVAFHNTDAVQYVNRYNGSSGKILVDDLNLREHFLHQNNNNYYILHRLSVGDDKELNTYIANVLVERLLSKPQKDVKKTRTIQMLKTKAPSLEIANQKVEKFVSELQEGKPFVEYKIVSIKEDIKIRFIDF